jgi:signal transduction histidine kinase
VQVQDDRAVLAVEDDGPGVAVGERPDFATLGSHASPRGGLGIGTWLADRIAVHHGGALALARSRDPTVVTLALPIERS